MDCNVCCEKLNKSNRKEIICNYCDYSICRACFQKYLTESIEDPHCMNCKKQFNRDFLGDNCTLVFFNTTFKEHRKNILLDREKALLIETQPYVTVEREKIKMRAEITKIYCEIEKLDAAKRALHEKINMIQIRISRININNSEEIVKDEHRKFIRKCPMNECLGFLSSRWKCGTCDTYICNKCNEPKENDAHTCNPDNVASMELLNKDTKPCPECATMVYRISGCSQMWCTNCNTPWDWNTGKKVNGTIHNPHYYEFIRNGGNGGRNLGDIPCGGVPYIEEIRTLCTQLHINNKTLYEIHNVVTHIANYEIREVGNIDIVTFNRGLRVDYMLNKIDEDYFKKTLILNEKNRQKSIDFRNIFQMFVDVASDILRQMIVFHRENKCFERSNKFVDEQVLAINTLVDYFNENTKKIGKRFNVISPGISRVNNRYRFVNNYRKIIIPPPA